MQNKVLLTLLVAGAVVILGGLWLLFGQPAPERDSETGDISAEIVAAFQDELVSRGVEKQGQPIHGFDAFLLLQAFPGLQEQDFDGVLAFEGVYKYKNGDLVYERSIVQPVTSAEKTVSDQGYATLLKNVASRIGKSVQTREAVLEIIDAFEQPSPRP